MSPHPLKPWPLTGIYIPYCSDPFAAFLGQHKSRLKYTWGLLGSILSTVHGIPGTHSDQETGQSTPDASTLPPITPERLRHAWCTTGSDNALGCCMQFTWLLEGIYSSLTTSLRLWTALDPDRYSRVTGKML